MVFREFYYYIKNSRFLEGATFHKYEVTSETNNMISTSTEGIVIIFRGNVKNLLFAGATRVIKESKWK